MPESEARELLESLGINVSEVSNKPLADKVKAYVKCLLEQPVEKVKQINEGIA